MYLATNPYEMKIVDAPESTSSQASALLTVKGVYISWIASLGAIFIVLTAS